MPNEKVDPISRIEELENKETLTTKERKEKKQLDAWSKSGMTRMEAYKLFNAALADIWKTVLTDVGRHGIRISSLEKLLVDRGIFTQEELTDSYNAVRNEIKDLLEKQIEQPIEEAEKVEDINVAEVNPTE